MTVCVVNSTEMSGSLRYVTIATFFRINCYGLIFGMTDVQGPLIVIECLGISWRPLLFACGLLDMREAFDSNGQLYPLGFIRPRRELFREGMTTDLAHPGR